MTQDVFKAIFVNDFDDLQKIYAKHDLGTDILDEHGMTPLQHAAYKGNEQIVRWLLDRVSRFLATRFFEFFIWSASIFLIHICRFAGRRRQLGKTQVPVHRSALRRAERQPGRVQFTLGGRRQERTDQHRGPYRVTNGRFCRFVCSVTFGYLYTTWRDPSRVPSTFLRLPRPVGCACPFVKPTLLFIFLRQS